MMRIAHLPDRRVLEMSGADRIGFLQGLVSNDVATLKPGEAVWTGFLTPQGRYLADFFAIDADGSLLIDIPATQAEMVMRKLLRFRLRNQVDIAATDRAVYVAWDGDFASAATEITATEIIGAEISVADPRLPGIAQRVIGGAVATNATAQDWDRYRLSLALPSEHDMEPEKTLLLEAGFDELHGVSWTKGCYMGQELTARTKYRGLLKKRLLPVRIAGDRPENGAAIFRGSDEVGTMRSSQDGLGMALLRLDVLDNPSVLQCGDATLEVWRPAWMNVAEAS
jgi:folate-binding protein YgfZ